MKKEYFELKEKPQLAEPLGHVHMMIFHIVNVFSFLKSFTINAENSVVSY